MQEITAQGRQLPILFGIRTLELLAQARQSTLGDIIGKIQASPADVAVNFSLIIDASTVALNEGARRSGRDERYTSDDVVDMIDDAPELMPTLAKYLGESAQVYKTAFTTGQNRPKNQTKPKVNHAK